MYKENTLNTKKNQKTIFLKLFLFLSLLFKNNVIKLTHNNQNVKILKIKEAKLYE